MHEQLDPRGEPPEEIRLPDAPRSMSLPDFFKGEQLTRQRNLYDPASTEPFKISRSRIDLFVSCEQCFYLDRRLGVERPDLPAFTLNNAVDSLMKREFDIYRATQTPHPLMVAHGIDAVPLAHPDLEKWRDSLRRGAEVPVPGTRLRFAGGVDDLWMNSRGEVHVVDYKATSTTKPITLDGPFKAAYLRQVEMYQWIFKELGLFPISPVAYFVYVNGDASGPRFDARLPFKMEILAHTGDSGWVRDTLVRAAACLESDTVPPPSRDCAHCRFRAGAAAAER